MKDIKKIFEKRKKELTALLLNNSEEIELEKQHQIYGAINEIDVFLNTIDEYDNNMKKRRFIN